MHGSSLVHLDIDIYISLSLMTSLDTAQHAKTEIAHHDPAYSAQNYTERDSALESVARALPSPESRSWWIRVNDASALHACEIHLHPVGLEAHRVNIKDEIDDDNDNMRLYIDTIMCLYLGLSPASNDTSDESAVVRRPRKHLRTKWQRHDQLHGPAACNPLSRGETPDIDRHLYEASCMSSIIKEMLLYYNTCMYIYMYIYVRMHTRTTLETSQSHRQSTLCFFPRANEMNIQNDVVGPHFQGTYARLGRFTSSDKDDVCTLCEFVASTSCPVHSFQASDKIHMELWELYAVHFLLSRRAIPRQRSTYSRCSYCSSLSVLSLTQMHTVTPKSFFHSEEGHARTSFQYLSFLCRCPYQHFHKHDHHERRIAPSLCLPAKMVVRIISIVTGNLICKAFRPQVERKRNRD